MTQLSQQLSGLQFGPTTSIQKQPGMMMPAGSTVPGMSDLFTWNKNILIMLRFFF